jgi:lipopolysaccharide transport system permease protein
VQPPAGHCDRAAARQFKSVMSFTTEQSSQPDDAATAGPAETAPSERPLTVIEARTGWQALDLAELWRYRELLFFLAWRDVKVRYKQTALGVAWAILQPTLMMVVFTLVLGRLAGAASGDIPYPLYVYAGLLPWTFFASAISSAGQSVVSAERLVTKVYFPRLAIPLAAIGAALLDFALAAVVLAGLMIWYRVAPSPSMLLVPGLVCLLTLAAVGVGTLLSALNVAYRDVRHALPFLVQLWLFATPSIYLDPGALPDGEPRAAAKSAAPASVASSKQTGEFRDESPEGGSRRFSLLDLNPLDGLIAFFRCALLGCSLPWTRLVYPAIASPCLLLAGSLYFTRVEDSFADII